MPRDPRLAPPLRRDLSYRKPVPEYVPSPTISPVLPTSGLPVSSTAERPPPLPRDWRELIRGAQVDTGAADLVLTAEVGFEDGRQSFVMRDVRHSELASSITLHELPFSHFRAPDHWDESGYSLGSTPLSQSPRRAHRRTLPQVYRPPTPPLPTHYKRRRANSSGAPLSNPAIVGHMVYPDRPSAVLLQESHADPMSMAIRPPSPTTPTEESMRKTSFKASDTKSSFTLSKNHSEHWFYVSALPLRQNRGSACGDTLTGCALNLRCVFGSLWEICRNWGRLVLIRLGCVCHGQEPLMGEV